MLRIAALSALLAAGLLGGCASPQLKAERAALAAYNRCTMAVEDLNQASHESCLSRRLREERAAGKAAPEVRDERLRAMRDTRPYRTEVRGAIVAPDLTSVTLETLNHSGFLDQRVEHLENIVLIKEDGRWVIDKDCCDYSASTLVDEQGRPIELPPTELERQQDAEAVMRCEIEHREDDHEADHNHPPGAAASDCPAPH